MNVYCDYRTPWDICDDICIIAKNKKLVARPWNQYQPEISEWWLVPSNEWPAYKHGKYFFKYGEENSILCGLYVEKGFDPSVKEYYSSPKGSRQIMQRDWEWFHFLEDLKTGKIENLIRAISRKLPVSIEFHINGGNSPDSGSFDPYAPRFGWDKYHFDWLKSSQKFKLVEAIKDAKLLNELLHIKSFGELSSTLEKFNSSYWLWIDFFIGIRFYFSKADNTDKKINQIWDTEKMWKKFLCNFSPWIQ
jgi:hypothetical protein